MLLYMETKQATATAFAPVLVGISPAGVEWYAYKPEHVAPMTERLAALTAKHEAKQAAKRVRRVKLTAKHADMLEDAIAMREDDSAERIDLGRTYIRASVADLEDLAAYFDAEEVADAAESASLAETDQQLDLVWRSAYASALLLSSRLRGHGLTLRAARAKAARAR